MSRLDELITELCPDGVEFVTLGNLCEISSAGVDKKINEGEQPVKLLNYMDVYRNKHITKEILTMKVTAPVSKVNNCNIEKGDIFITPTSETIDDIGHAAVAIETIDGGVYSYHLMRLRLKEFNMTTSFYMCYVFASNSLQKQILKMATGLTRFGLSKGNWEKVHIPLPPLPVQQEIVRILDNFTELTAELTAELIAELTARKKQYEYYRNELLSFDDNVPRVKLVEIADISRGVRVVKKQLEADGAFPVFQNSLAPMGYYDKHNCNANTTYVISAGAAGEIGFCDKDFWAADDCLIFSNLNGVINKYIYYFLMTKQDFIRSNVRKASIPRLSRTVIENLQIPLVPVDEQERIISILDRFDKLCNDLFFVLPTEIEARRKQYEYYRDKLLSFEEANA